MCLSIPSKIKSIDTEMNTCVVDTMGVERSASLDLIDQDVKIGDYVLIHIGFAMNKIRFRNLSHLSFEIYPINYILK